MTHIRYLPLLAVVFALLLFSSCTDREDLSSSVEDGQIAFSIDTSNLIGQTTVTRGTQTSTSALTNFGVCASKYSANDIYTTASIGSFFYNVNVDASTGKTGYYWPGVEYNVSFFAYSPYGNENLTISGEETKGYPVYTYVVPNDNFKQVDFITANNIDHSGSITNDKVPLSFKHHLTDIHLTVKNIGFHDMEVHTITLRTLHDKGTYNDGTGWTLPETSNETPYKQFTAVFGKNTVPGQATASVTGDGGHFMMLPQTIAKDSDFLVVDVTFGGHRDTLTYKLPESMTFEEGKGYNLNIALGTEYIDVQAEVEDWKIETGYNFQHNINLSLEAEEWVKQDNYDNPGDIKHINPDANDWDNQGTYNDPTTINTNGNEVDDWQPQGE